MTHRDEHLSAERIQAFLDGELSQEEMARVQGHSAACVRCQSEIDAWRLLFDELEDLPRLDPSPSLAQRVLRGVPGRAAAGLMGTPAATPGSGHLGALVLQDLLDGGLEPGAAIQAHAHVSGCQSCQRDLHRWQAVFAQLEGLEDLAPAVGFAERVMQDLPQLAPVGLLARLRGRTSRPQGHLSPERIQNLLDGSLAGRDRSGARSHLAACGSCRDAVDTWNTLFSGLESMAELVPSEGFSNRVMSRVRVRAPVPVVRTPLATRLGRWMGVPRHAAATAVAGVERLLPRSRRAWAVLTSMAAAPTVALAAAIVYLFSNPLLTPQYLGAYLWWKASEAVSGVMTRAGALGLEASEVLRGNALVEAVAASPGGMAVAALLLASLMGLSLLVVYRNLFAPSATARYARFTS